MSVPWTWRKFDGHVWKMHNEIIHSHISPTENGNKASRQWPKKYLNIPCAWYPAAFAKHFIDKIGAIECITKGIFSIKCIAKVLYEMTLLYIKDQTWHIFAHQKVVDYIMGSQTSLSSNRFDYVQWAASMKWECKKILALWNDHCFVWNGYYFLRLKHIF